MPPRRKGNKHAAVEDIIIDVPSGDESEDEAEDEAEAERRAATDARAERLLSVNIAELNVADLIAGFREAQVVMSDFKERNQTLTFKLHASKKDTKCTQCGRQTKSKLTPPPDLADKENEIKEAGREYAFTYVPWAPDQAFHLQVIPVDIDPDDYKQRYPQFGDKALALVYARAKEFQDYLLEPFVAHMRNKWFKSVISLGINSHRGHMLKNCRDARSSIFAHIKDIDTNLAFWRGDGEMFPRIFYPNGDDSQKRFLLRSEALLNVLRICAFGSGALVVGHVPRSNTTARLWGIENTTIGMIAMGMVFVRYLLSGMSVMKRGPWQAQFEDYAKFLMQKRDLPSILRLFAWFDYRLFSKAGIDGDELPLEQAPTDDWENDDWSALGEDWDDPLLSVVRPIKNQRSVAHTSGIFRRARADDLSHALTAALDVQARPQGSSNDSGTATPGTPPTRLQTPVLSPTVTPPAPGQPGRVTIGETDFDSVYIPEDVESISIAMSRAFSSLPVQDHPAPVPVAAAPMAMAPPPVPAHVAAIPQARVAAKGRQGRPKAVVIPVAGPSQQVIAIPVPVPDAADPKPKPKPKPRGRTTAKETAKGNGKGKAPAALEDKQDKVPVAKVAPETRVLRKRKET